MESIKSIIDKINKVKTEDCGCEEKKEFLDLVLPNEKSKREFKVIKTFSYKANKYYEGTELVIDNNSELKDIIISLSMNGTINEI